MRVWGLSSGCIPRNGWRSKNRRQEKKLSAGASFFAPSSSRPEKPELRMSQASQPCAGVISKMGGKWGMSFGGHFKFSISSVHCKVFWRVSNYLFNIGSFLISSVSEEDEEFPSKPTALWQQKHFPLLLLLLLSAKSSFVRLFGCRRADACDA